MRHEHDRQAQRHTVQDLLDARDLVAERRQQLRDALRQGGDHGRAEHRPEQRADAADAGRQQNLDRTQDAEDLLGEQVVLIEREEHAAQRRHAGRHLDRIHLVAEGVDAGGARGFFVVANGAEIEAQPAAQQPSRQHEAEDGQCQRQVVEHQRRAAQVQQIGAIGLHHPQEETARAADPAEMIEADARELGERDRQQREVGARDAEAKRQPADDGGHQHAHAHRHDHTQPWDDAEMLEQRRRGVSAQPDVQRMADRELAAETHHHVPGLAQIGEIQHQDHHRQQVAVEPQRHHQQHGEQDQQGRARTPGRFGEHGDQVAAQVHRPPPVRESVDVEFIGPALTCPKTGLAAGTPAPGSAARTTACSWPTA